MDAEPQRVAGVCHALFCYDIGMGVDLDALESRVEEATRLRVVRVRRPSPAWFEYEPAPVRLTIAGEPIGVGAWASEAAVECLVYDFGAVAVRYRIPFDGEPGSLIPLGVALYDHEALLRDSRARVGQLVRAGGAAVNGGGVSELVEDYAVYALSSWGGLASGVIERDADAFARLLQAEPGRLAPERIVQALGGRISYDPEDLTVIDWNGALLFDPEPEDTLTVLTHANIELLEARWLDGQLDRLLDRSHELMRTAGRRALWPIGREPKQVREFASLQTDSALLFEGVNNAIKLIGDQHLARVYELASGRLHLPGWDASVLRKLAVAESVYEKMTDRASTQRLEVLEWIIIVLILVSIIMPLVGIGH